MEKAPKNENFSTILEQTKIRDFIEAREVAPEDFYLLEELADFSKNMIILTMHNLFNTHRDKSGKELEVMIKNADDPSEKELFETMQKFYQKYGWAASWNLVRLLEGEY